MVVVQQSSGLPSALPSVKDTAVGVGSELGRTARGAVAVTPHGNFYDRSYLVR
jgi:hypothetical protein